jgi:hypothetical protein
MLQSASIDGFGSRLTYRTFRLLGELVSVVLFFGISALFFLGGLASRQSVDLSSLRPNMERWFSQSFEGSKAELGDIGLQWNPVDKTVTFRIDDVIVYDRDDRIVQTLERLEATTRREDLFARRPSLLDVDIVGGDVSWVERLDGTIIAGLGTPQTVGGLGPVYHGREEAAEPLTLDWLGDFQTLALQDSRAHIVREADDFHVVMDIETLRGARDETSAALDIAANLLSKNQDAAGRFKLELDVSDAFDVFNLSLDAAGLRPDLLAPQSGRYVAVGAIQAPVELALNGQYSRQNGLQSAQADLRIADGVLQLAGQAETLQRLLFQASLNPGDEEMRVDRFELEAEHLKFSADGLIKEIGRFDDGDVGTSPKFDLTFGQTWLDLTPTFAAPLEVKTANAVGELDLDTQTLSFDRVEADLGSFALGFKAVLSASRDGIREVSIEGKTRTVLDADGLLSVWPVKAADGARRWIDRSVVEGTLHNVEFDVALDSAFFVDPVLNAERLQVTFDVRDGTVRYISTMEPLVEAFGSGRIDGNRMGFVLDRGRIGPIEISGGDVDIPRLTPKGGDIFISAEARGELSALMALINQPPFQYMDRYGAAPDGFGGEAEVTLNIRRPLLEYFDEGRIEYDVEGSFSNASAPFTFGDYSITNADVSLRGGKDGLFVDGPVSFGPWRANLAWAERYGQNGEPTRYRLTGLMDRKTLDGFGLGFREYFGGAVHLDLEASGMGLNITEGFATIDLQPAELSFGTIWSKPIDEPGEIKAEIKRNNGAVAIPRLNIQAPGLTLEGDMAFDSGFALENFAFNRLQIAGLVDGAVRLSRNEAADRLLFEASGQSLDVSDFVRDYLQQRPDEPVQLPLDVSAEFETLILGPDYSLQKAVFNYRNDGQELESMSLLGSRPEGLVTMEMSPRQSGGHSVILNIPDLSDAATSLLGLGGTSGGAFRLTAILPDEAMDAPVIGSAIATDFTVQRAPFLAQILSLASLTGIVDTLSGDGLGFDELAFDFGLKDRQLSVRDAKLRGPALGMTGAGEIRLAAQEIDFTGTLVPAYTANSILGDLPIFGDLLIGRDGEGVFAVNYAIEGPFSGALISINPLSALTPGFIRGIFREDRQDLPEMVTDTQPQTPNESVTERDGANISSADENAD